jgi:hypothetical protein
MEIKATRTRARKETFDEILAGQLIAFRHGANAIIGWSDGSMSVYLFVNQEDGEQRLMQFVVNSDPLWDGEKAMSALSEWEGNSTRQKPLTVRGIRGIPVTKILAEARRIQQIEEKEEDVFKILPKISISNRDGVALGFSSLADFASSFEQLTTAIGYTAAISRGAVNPVRVVADSQFDGDIQKARNRLSAARRNDFLTRGEKGSGRQQGQLTPKANEFIKAIRNLKQGKTNEY